MVDLMLRLENLGYQEENWKESRASAVSGGNTPGVVTGEGMMKSGSCMSRMTRG